MTIFNRYSVANDFHWWCIEYAIRRAWCEFMRHFGAEMKGHR